MSSLLGRRQSTAASGGVTGVTGVTGVMGVTGVAAAAAAAGVTLFFNATQRSENKTEMTENCLDAHKQAN